MSAALPRRTRDPAAAGVLRRRRLGGAGLRGGRRAAAAPSVGRGRAAWPPAGARRPCTARLTPSPLPSLTRRWRPTVRPLFGGWAELAASDRAPSAGLDEWARDHLDSAGRAGVGLAGGRAGPTLLHGDVRVRQRAARGDDGVVVFVDWPHAVVGVPGLRRGRLGALGGAGGGTAAPEELLALSVAAGRRSIPRWSPSWWPPSAGFLGGALAAAAATGAPDAPRLPGRPGCGGAGLARSG